MTIYWLMFVFFALGAFLSSGSQVDSDNTSKPVFVLGGILIVAVVGLRYHVGADWLAYQAMFRVAGHMDFIHALKVGDPAYQALNWLVRQVVDVVWPVNVFCAAIFTWGLLRFCAFQPLPWAAVLSSIPYTVIVVAMGYTRQAVALGILMAGLAAVLRGGSALRFALYVLMAALFHKTAIVMYPIVALTMQRNRISNLLFAAAMCVLLYDMFLGNAMDGYIREYIRTQYSSQGALIRIAMSLLATAIFVFGRRQLEFSELELRLWRSFSIVTVGLLVLFFVSPSSTIVDRLSLYVLPLQFAMWSRVPRLFRSQVGGTAVVVSYAFAVQFVWLNYAQFARLWVPYRFVPI